MLLRFAVTNHLSIRDRVEITFVATQLKELNETLLPSQYARHGLLPVLALYGANASGKSNVLHALMRLRLLVITSFKRQDDEENFPFSPFRLDDVSGDKPTEFELDFIYDGIRYQFGTHINASGILKEWLYTFPKSHQQVLYFRDVESKEGIYFGRNLTGSLRQIESITKKKSLFLSTAKQSGHPVLSKISDIFKRGITVELRNGNASGQTIADRLKKKPEIQEAVSRYLTLADTGISNIRVETIPVAEQERTQVNELMKAMSKWAGTDTLSEAPETKNQLQLGHLSGDGKVRYLDFRDESLGTQYLLTLLPLIVETLQTGGVLVLDEITTSLHTILAKHLVGLFTSKTVNAKGAQLLFTTHDTNLLNQEILRRDEIWLVEKAQDGTTTINPLSDIKTKNTDNLEKGYLQGRFGGIPFINIVS